MMEDTVGVLSPKYNLEPPHYDGIQSLCLMGDLLFTGSRDTCIKKWDLAEQQQKHVSIRLRPSVTVDSYVYIVLTVMYSNCSCCCLECLYVGVIQVGVDA